MDLLKEKYGWGNAPDETAGPYILKCRKFVENDEAFSNFRRDFDYGKILSGDPKIVGDIAIDSIKKFNQFNFLLDNLDEIKKNDKVGNPYLYEYDQLGEINPSTLKYFNTIVEIKPLIGDYVTKKLLKLVVDMEDCVEFLMLFMILKNISLLTCQMLLNWLKNI